MIQVVNVYAHQKTATDVSIMRPSVLGNPFSFKQGTTATQVCDTREQAVSLYGVWLAQKLADKDPAVCQEMNRLYLLARRGNLNLCCCCKPKLCHGDVIRAILNEKL